MFWINLVYNLVYWIAAGLAFMIGLVKKDKMEILGLRERPINIGKSTIIAVFIVCIIAAFSLSMLNIYLTDIAAAKKEKDDKAEIADLKAQLHSDKVSSDSLLHKTTLDMTKVFGDASKINIEEHLKTQQKEDVTQEKIDSTQKKIDKIDTTRGMYASVGLLADSSNVLRVKMEGNILSVTCALSNTSNGAAYSLRSNLKIVFILNDVLLKSNPKDNQIPIGRELMPNTQQNISMEFSVDKDVYNHCNAIYCIVYGTYFLDDNGTKPKKFQYITGINPKTKRYIGNNLLVSIDSFWNAAKPYSP